MTIEDYAFAQAEFHTYKRTLADYAARLTEAGTLLRERTDRVSLTGVGLGPALAVRPSGGPELIDGRALPQPVDIQRMLVRYHGAYERLRTTWDGLPPAERGGLRPPPPSLPTLVPAGLADA